MRSNILKELKFTSEIGVKNKRPRSADTAEAILKSAIVLFSEKGYDATSTHAIAAHAGVNQGLITYHFGNKEKLWKSAVDEMLGSFRNRLLEEALSSSEEEDFEVFFRKILYAHIEWSAKNPHIYLMLLEISRSKDGLEVWYLERHVRPAYNFLVSIIDEGKKLGVIKNHPSDNIYYLIVTSSLVFNLRDESTKLTKTNTSSNEFISSHSKMMFEMIRA